MSITDKIPKAPEGYHWRSSVSVTSDNTRIYLRLDPDDSVATFSLYIGAQLYAFVEPTEEAVIRAANVIITDVEENIRLDAYLKAKTAEASVVYSDLITGD